MDKYGFTQNHPNFTLELEDNYVNVLPIEARSIATAIQYAEQWHIDFREILDMMFDDFYRAMMVTKAITYKKPWWTGASGEHAFALEKIGNKRMNKPKRTQQ